MYQHPAQPTSRSYTNQQVAFLDQVAVSIRKNTGASLNRSAMLQAFIDSLQLYFQDWLQCRSEAELKATINRRLQRLTSSSNSKRPGT
jgi:hypothetical protein